MAKRRVKRVFPKRYASNYINVTQRPRALVTDFDHPEGTKPRKQHRPNQVSHDHWFNNQARVLTVVGPAHSKEVKLNNTWTKPIPKTKGFKERYWTDDTGVKHLAQATPRMVVQRILRSWCSEDGSKHGIDEFYSTTIAEWAGVSVKLFVSGNLYYWVKEHGEEGWFKRSTLYVGREAAWRVYHNSKILWTEYGRLDKAEG